MLRINALLFSLMAIAYVYGIVVDPFELHSRDVLHQLFLVTGLASWTLMAECIVIAARPAWLEKVYGEPLDRLMHGHKTLGWWMVGTALLHFLAPVYAMLIPVEQVPAMTGGYDMSTPLRMFWIILHPVGALLGILVSLYMIRIVWIDCRHVKNAVTWDRWEKIHRMWAWAFVGMALHSTRLLRENEMLLPIGWFTFAVTLIGLFYSIMIIARRPGSALRKNGTITGIEKDGTLMIVSVKTSLAQSIVPGQFAYLSFAKDREDPHPFTVSGVDREKGELVFWIKDVGAWTALLAQKSAGDEILVEGHWGTFLPEFDSSGKQLWVAGGIGIAPFVAWLDAAAERRKNGGTIPETTLVWSVRGAKPSGGLEQIREKCNRAGVSLVVFDTAETKRHLSADDLDARNVACVSVCAGHGLAAECEKLCRKSGSTVLRAEIY